MQINSVNYSDTATFTKLINVLTQQGLAASKPKSYTCLSLPLKESFINDADKAACRSGGREKFHSCLDSLNEVPATLPCYSHRR